VENVAPECTVGKLDISYIVLPAKHVDIMGFKPEALFGKMWDIT